MLQTENEILNSEPAALSRKSDSGTVVKLPFKVSKLFEQPVNSRSVPKK